MKDMIEIDGLAYSSSDILLVERKPRILKEHVEELALKLERFR